MLSNLMMSIRTLIAHPDRPDRDAFFAAIANVEASEILACLAPPGSLLQIAAALHVGWLWLCDGWDWQTDELVGIITDPRCPFPEQMITTWSRIPSAVGVLRDRTAALVAWAQQQLDPKKYDNLATLLGPSDESARLLVQSPSSRAIGTTLRRWSMAISPDDPTAWQAMIDAALRNPLRRKASPSEAFPAWGWDNDVNSDTIFNQIVNDLVDGWSPDHPSFRGRIGWLENHVVSNLFIDRLALMASIGSSDALAEVVCARLGHNPSFIPRIAEDVPWSQLHPRIQTVIDETMRRSSNDRWARTWACAIGTSPLVPDNDIDARLLLWRIDQERWNDRDPSIRAALVSSIDPPDHCYGWGVHIDLVGCRNLPYETIFHIWNPDVPSDDLRAWAYADVLRAQRSRQDAQVLIALLMTLPPDRRVRFEAIIDGRLGGRSESTAQAPWDWAGWAALPAADRQQRLRDRLTVLWGDRTTLPAVRFWRARNDGLATLAMMVGGGLGLDDPSPILAALLAQIPALRGDETEPTPPLHSPTTMDVALRAQIERLPLTPDAQAYAAWCLWIIARDADVGADLIAIHPDVAVALAPVLTDEQRAMVIASPAAQGWESMTHMHWTAACTAAQEPTTLPRQRRL